MPEKEYGVVALADLLLAAMVQLLGANLLSGMTRFYFDHPDPERRNRVVSSCTLLLSGVAFGTVALMLPFRDALSPILLTNSDGLPRDTVTQIFTIAILIVPFQLASQCGAYYLMILKRSGAFAAFNLFKLIFELSLKIYLVGFAGMGPVGYLLPVLIGEMLMTLLVTGWALKRCGFGISREVLRPILAYTLPLIPVGVFQLGLHYGDRRLLEWFSPPDRALDEVGIYEVGYKIAFLVTAGMLGPFLQIFHPWIYGVSDPDEQAKKVASTSTYAITAITAATLLVVLFSRQAMYFLPWAVYHVTQIPLYIAKRTGPLFWINLIALLLNILCNATFVPTMGFVGSGLATLLTFLPLAGLGAWAALRVMPVPFELRRMAVAMLVMTAASLAAYGLDANWPPTDWFGLGLTGLVKLAVALVLIAGLWFGVLTSEERGRVVERFASRRSAA
jgi:O-antigen/teichoic acid export membrane protein